MTTGDYSCFSDDVRLILIAYQTFEKSGICLSSFDSVIDICCRSTSYRDSISCWKFVLISSSRPIILNTEVMPSSKIVTFLRCPSQFVKRTERKSYCLLEVNQAVLRTTNSLESPTASNLLSCFGEPMDLTTHPQNTRLQMEHGLSAKISQS